MKNSQIKGKKYNQSNCHSKGRQCDFACSHRLGTNQKPNTICHHMHALFSNLLLQYNFSINYNVFNR